MDLELRHYGTADGTFDLYDDDGETLDYENGKSLWLTLSVERDADGALRGCISPDNTQSVSYDRMTWKFMTDTPHQGDAADADNPRS